jgi:hypothetical protein
MVCILGPNCYCVYIPETNQPQAQLPIPPIFFRLNLLMLPSPRSAPSATLRISTSIPCQPLTPTPPLLQALTLISRAPNRWNPLHSSRLTSSRRLNRPASPLGSRQWAQRWAQSRALRAMILARNCSPRHWAHAHRISLGAHSHSVELVFLMHDMIPHHPSRLAQWFPFCVAIPYVHVTCIYDHLSIFSALSIPYASNAYHAIFLLFQMLSCCFFLYERAIPHLWSPYVHRRMSDSMTSLTIKKKKGVSNDFLCDSNSPSA